MKVSGYIPGIEGLYKVALLGNSPPAVAPDNVERRFVVLQGGLLSVRRFVPQRSPNQDKPRPSTSP